MNKVINITFDNSINFNGYFVNGLIYSYDNEITIKINPDSKENILFILIHELTHLLDLKYLKELFIVYITNFKSLWKYLILNNKIILTNEVKY